MNDPYALPNGVLRNKLDITDHQLLDAAEADITQARLIMLAVRPLPGAYDLGHSPGVPCRNLRRHLSVGRRVTHREHRQAHTVLPGEKPGVLRREVFDRLASSGHLRDLSRQEFIIRLPSYTAP
ncbi:hypothetical protein ACGFOM_29645 [Streptomyces sp. NPDC048594]|uniref:hypothetical protein n=1 Tax=Streptomyces sp. NPDC048594 TaxID=3365575 RepID=UPI00371F6097